ncbi:MAG TPA: hypothetical protein PLS95_04470 [Thermoanaerobaculales bacterium]|mgnify:CR=1 FL=1|nr:hypothetical protein [Thermoanaerobaculales bacterium]
MSELVCPHCGTALSRFSLPDNTGWEGEHQLACFSDECPYYRRGWQHMEARYAVTASYRYRVDPISGCASPLAVWSPTALRDRILDPEPELTGAAHDGSAG